MQWHPYAKLFPMMDAEAVEDLAEDIRVNGLRHPIVIDAKERIIDGRNRDAACTMAGVEPVYEPFIGSDKEILAFVISANLKRRHLTESQRSMIAGEIAKLPVGKPPTANSANLLNTDPPVTQREAAKLLNVSPRSVTAAKKVQKSGTPELQQAVRDGKVSVSRAAKVAALPPSEQAQRIVEKHRTSEPKPNGKQTFDVMTESAKQTNDILKQVSAVSKAVTALCQSKAGAFVNSTLVNRTLRELRQELKRAALAQPCRDCKGKGCMLCRDVGHVTAAHYE